MTAAWRLLVVPAVCCMAACNLDAFEGSSVAGSPSGLVSVGFLAQLFL
jgi:hypothetical protein